MKKIILALAAIGILAGVMTCCNTTGQGSIKPLEEMSDLEYSKWKLYIQLGVKIGANRLVQQEIVSTEELGVAADVIEAVKDGPVVVGAKSLILPALEKAGFNNDEVELVLLIAEQELLARGALEWINPETGALDLSPRTQEMLGIIAGSLRTAGTVTSQEASQASELKADFCRQ